jgi:hypothetical protein
LESLGRISRTMRYITIIALLFALFSQAACTTNVTVAGSLPTPLIKQIPVRVGVYYSENFKSYEHKEVLPESGSYRIDLGVQNLSFFRNLVQALFVEVIELDSPQLSEAQKESIDVVLVPEIAKYGFLVPAISTLTFYEASIEYRLAISDTDGNSVGDWNIVGYGKAEASMFGGGDAVGEATMLAIRDGGARIATEVSPEIESQLLKALASPVETTL